MVNFISIIISLISLGIICWFVVKQSIKERDLMDKKYISKKATKKKVKNEKVD